MTGATGPEGGGDPGGDAGGDAGAAITEHPGCPPGSRYPLLPGVRSRMVQTPRLAQHVYESGPADGELLLWIHGNASSARWFEDLMAALPEYHILAPDLRGYGATALKRADASRGLRDYSDDVHALVETLGLERFHLLGWSLGGGVAMQYVLDHPERVRTLTLHATMSPYGYGGTRDAAGTLTYDDFAGSGAALINALLVERLAAKDLSADSLFTARSAVRLAIAKPGFLLPPEREDAMVEQMLLMAIGDEYYPGDTGLPSPNWPHVTPGLYGPNNAVSPKNCNLSSIAELRGGPPILWLRGTDDLIVRDGGSLDLSYLGKIGLAPGWPGDEVCPPQPMIAQLRAVLDRYATNGGSYQEVVFENCGHAPVWEKQDEVAQHLRAFLGTSPIAVDVGARQASPDVPASPVASEVVDSPVGAAADDTPTEPDAPAIAMAAPGGGRSQNAPMAPEPVAPIPVTSGAPAASTPQRKRRSLFGFLRRRQ